MSDSNKNNSLEDLLSKCKQTINNSDWLKENSANQWEADNPEAAIEYRKAAAVEITSNNNTHRLDVESNFEMHCDSSSNKESSLLDLMKTLKSEINSSKDWVESQQACASKE